MYLKKEKVSAVAQFDNGGGTRFIDMLYNFHMFDIVNYGCKSSIWLDGERFKLPAKSIVKIHKNASKVEFRSGGETYIEAIGHMFTEDRKYDNV